MSEPAFPPAMSCDCHTHVIGPKARYPLVSPRAYTPMDAPTAALEAMLASVGVERVVLVQTSIFGTDNSCMLDAVAALGERARAVAVPPADADGASLDQMDRAGVRGVRVNLWTLGLDDPEEARRQLGVAVSQCARNGWHLQLFAAPATIVALEADLAALPVPVVFDHFGLISPASEGTPAEGVIVRLLGSGQAWIKLSGTYRLSPPEHSPQMAALAQRLHAANPERTVWGSDWPHAPAHPGGVAKDDRELPYRDVEDAALLGTIREWFDEPAQRAILSDNPARLYGF